MALLGGFRSINLWRPCDDIRPRLGARQKRSVRSCRSRRYAGESEIFERATRRWPAGDDIGMVGHLANNITCRPRFGHRFSFSGVRLVGVLLVAVNEGRGTRSFFRSNIWRNNDCFSRVSGTRWGSSCGRYAESSVPQNMTSSSYLQFLSCS